MDFLFAIIDSEQGPDGSFLGVSETGARFPVTFVTSLILSALGASSNHPDAVAIFKKAERFLVSERSPANTWNYWARKSADSKRLPCPDDWDDTSVAIAGLSAFDPQFSSGTVMARIVKMLTATESAEGGPYFTWIVSDPTDPWRDIDIAVNANVAAMLSVMGILPETLTRYFDARIAALDFTSNYYDEIGIIYFLAKSYRGTFRGKLLGCLRKNKKRFTKTALNRARFVSSWLRLGGSVSSVANDIIMIKSARSVSADPFYVQEISKGDKTRIGSRALAAACMIEALAVYENHIKGDLIETDKAYYTGLASGILDQVLAKCPPGECARQLEVFGKRLVKNDPHHEISLLPYRFYKSLVPKLQKTIDENIIFDLCRANLLGWVAYTVYDAIIDGERKQSLLPLANICMRRVVGIYQLILGGGHFETAETIFDTIDQANLWEHGACHAGINETSFSVAKTLPQYKNLRHLAHKSLGHALGPIAIMKILGDIEGEKYIGTFFVHYLIARQLNDDAHDWLDDLRVGFINPVGAMLLKTWKEQYPERLVLDLTEGSTDCTDLQRLFWDGTIDWTSREIFRRTKKARNIARRCSALGDTTYLNSLLVSLEKAAQDAITERDKMKEFLEAYS